MLGILSLLVVARQPANAELAFTELAYNPASVEPNWEWIEIYNRGASAVDLSGYVLDDDDGVILSTANIAGGSIAPGGAAVLFNDLDIDAADFTAAWGGGMQLIAISEWPTLNNTGDVIALWDSLASYDNRTLVNAITWMSYDDAAPWPISNDASSITLSTNSADYHNAANWTLSATGLHGAYTSSPTGGNPGGDVGSPGVVMPEPASAVLACAFVFASLFHTRHRRFQPG